MVKKLFVNVEDIVKNVKLIYKGGFSTVKHARFSKLSRINYPNNCVDIDITTMKVKNKKVSLIGISQIEFEFREFKNYSIEIKVEDKKKSLSRDFQFNKFNMHGPVPSLEKLSPPSTRLVIHTLLSYPCLAFIFCSQL